MTSKERVLAALAHTETDRVPLDIGGINNTTMHYTVQAKLRKHLGFPDTGMEIRALNQNVVIPDDRILDYFGADCISIYFNESRPWKDSGDGTFIDMWGVTQKPNPDGLYYNMVRHPLENAESDADIDAYTFPELTPYMIEGLRERALKYPDKCLIVEGFREPMFGLPSWLRKNENFYTDIAADEDLCNHLLDRIGEFYLKFVDFIMAEVGDLVDIVKFADDLGAQQGLLLSPTAYRRIVKPHQAKLYGYVKEKYRKKILLHCCGSIRPIIGDLIEIGVDALNPVQISANDMEPEKLKAEFGKDITFWGGGIDTQNVLNHASPEEVKHQVKRNLGTFKPGGGYVFAQVHNIMPDVPVENILAMYESYRENASYLK
jgi:uroporphyrinogen decarboxylase